MKKQPSRKALPKRRLAQRPQKFQRLPHDQWMEFPQARGRTVERVELMTESEYHCISIRFQDKTDLSVEIDPCPDLTFAATFSDWKTHNQRVIKNWRRIRSKGVKTRPD